MAAVRGATRAALLEVRAETYARSGDFPSARNDLRAALSGTVSKPDRSRLLTRLTVLTSGSDDVLRAAELVDLALAEAGDDAGARARALHVAAIVDMDLDNLERAASRFDEALSLFMAVGDAAGMADILDSRAMKMFGHGDISGGIAAFDRVAKLFSDNGNLLRAGTLRPARGHGLLFAGRPQEGLADTESALELARSLGYAEGEAMVLWQPAEVLVGCGRAEEALAAAESGLAVARRVGHRGWTATTLLALGVARKALGDFAGAADAFAESLRTSENLTMFAWWAHARLALVLLAQGDVDEAPAMRRIRSPSVWSWRITRLGWRAANWRSRGRTTTLWCSSTMRWSVRWRVGTTRPPGGSWSSGRACQKLTILQRIEAFVPNGISAR